MIRHVMMLMLAVVILSVPVHTSDALTLPNPLRTAQPGQWVVYRINTLFGLAEQRQTLMRIDGEGEERIFTIKSEMSVDDEYVDERTDSISYMQAVAEQESALEDAEDVNIHNTSINFKGNNIDCTLVEFTQDGKKCRLYLSEDIPLVGMIRLEMEGMDEPAMELLDFGH